jgi:hypothetical protein
VHGGALQPLCVRGKIRSFLINGTHLLKKIELAFQANVTLTRPYFRNLKRIFKIQTNLLQDWHKIVDIQHKIGTLFPR